MKIAKAEEKDMDAAIQLAAILDNVSRGYYPTAGTDTEADGDPTFFDATKTAHLQVFHAEVMKCLDAAPGGLFRVVWGFHTIMHNDICDPNADVLELHPRIIQALAASDGAKAAATVPGGGSGPEQTQETA